MRYAHIISRVTSAPWLITEAGAEAVSALLNSRLAAEVEPPRLEPAPVVTEPPPESPGVAIIRVHGLIGKNLGLMETLCGGCDVDTIVDLIQAASTAPEISQILLHIDSPGGVAAGIPEAHAAINRIRVASGKRIDAIVEGQCCSAAFYLAAACDGIFCTPTSQLGSLGCILGLKFCAMKNASEGIECRTYKYGKFKDLGNPNRLPTPEEDALIQARVDYLGKMFHDDMRAARPQLTEAAFDALWFYGEQAIAEGLADALVSDMKTLLRELSSNPSI